MPESNACAWNVEINKSDLIDAIGTVRTRATLRRKETGLEADVMFVRCVDGISIRSSASAMDIPAKGSWVSPVSANGAALRRLTPKLAGPTITLRYETGRLLLNGTSLPAREA